MSELKFRFNDLPEASKLVTRGFWVVSRYSHCEPLGQIRPGDLEHLLRNAGSPKLTNEFCSKSSSESQLSGTWNKFSYRNRGMNSGRVPRPARKSPFNPQCVGLIQLTVLELCATKGPGELVYLTAYRTMRARVLGTQLSISPTHVQHRDGPASEQDWTFHVQNRCRPFSLVLIGCKCHRGRDFTYSVPCRIPSTVAHSKCLVSYCRIF